MTGAATAPASRMLLVTHGSDGDVLPFVRLGRVLRSRGHEVTLLTHAPYRGRAEAAGLEFVPIDTPERFERYSADTALLPGGRATLDWLDFYHRNDLFGQLAAECRALAERVLPGRTVLIGRHTSALSVLLVRELLGVPAAWVAVAPIQPMAAEVARHLHQHVLSKGIDGVRAGLGLGPVGDWRTWFSSADVQLGLWPRWFDEAGPRSGPGVHLTGFPLPDDGPGSTAPTPPGLATPTSAKPTETPGRGITPATGITLGKNTGPASLAGTEPLVEAARRAGPGPLAGHGPFSSHASFNGHPALGEKAPMGGKTATGGNAPASEEMPRGGKTAMGGYAPTGGKTAMGGDAPMGADDPADGEALPRRALEFLRGPIRPVLVTGGTGRMLHSSFYQAAIGGCRLAGLPVLLVAPHADLVPDPLPPDVAWFSSLPFRLVMPEVAAVLHHGGIGTLTRALAAGAPQVILAHGADRPDNAARLARAGLARWLPEFRWTAENVAAELTTALKTTGRHPHPTPGPPPAPGGGPAPAPTAIPAPTPVFALGSVRAPGSGSVPGSAPGAGPASVPGSGLVPGSESSAGSPADPGSVSAADSVSALAIFSASASAPLGASAHAFADASREAVDSLVLAAEHLEALLECPSAHLGPPHWQALPAEGAHEQRPADAPAERQPTRLSIEQRQAGASAEERLAGASAGERSAGAPAEQWSGRSAVEQRLAGLPVEQRRVLAARLRRRRAERGAP